MSLSVGILSTYAPTYCGLASFSASLAGELTSAGERVGIVRVVDGPEPMPSAEVVHHLERDGDGGAAAAAVLDRYDVIVVQHEFGVYGGTDGDAVFDVIDEVHRPLIVILHTVLAAPTTHQREVLERVCARADAVVTMSLTARDFLISGYQVDGSKITVIPHGAGPSNHGPRPSGAPVFLTWGLLGPGKGIESAIDAFAQLRHVRPSPRYRVVGQTHPKVLAREGEAYRRGLMARAATLDVGHLVSFHPNYLDGPSLARMIATADVVILPYESRDQVTSGVLIEAVAAGKPVVATAFPHAVELLSGGAGLVVPHNDPAALARALRRMLIEPRLVASMGDRAAEFAAELLWPAVAARYRRLAGELVDSSVALVG